MLGDIFLQIAQVLTVLLLAPLVQGIILQFQEQVELAQGPGPDLPALSRFVETLPGRRAWILLTGPHPSSPSPCSHFNSHSGSDEFSPLASV